MDEFQLRKALGSRPLRYLISTGSTNTDAIQWLGEDPKVARGAVVIADEQTQGRGRLGRHWLTPMDSAIAMSVILRDLPSPQQATILGAVAVTDVFESLVPGKVGIKWSNDVLLDGKKAGGILAEAVWNGTELQAIVLGIGLNIDVDFSSSDLSNIATSLSQFVKQPIKRVEIITQVLDRIDYWSAARPDDLFNTWKSRLTMLGDAVTVFAGERTVQGKAVDVDKDGALLLKTETGEIERFLAGDVTLRAGGII